MKCKYEGFGVWKDRCVGTKEVDPCVGYDKCDRFRPNCKTNADVINSMTVEEKADFLNSIAYGRQTPWSEPFYKKFCASCPTVSCTVEGYSKPMDFNECDFVDGKCPHGTDIVWWLNQPAEEDPDGT